MDKICFFVARLFYDYHIIDAEDINPLRFGLELILTQFITFVTFFFIGIYLDLLYETVIYIFYFIYLRKLIHGYHAKTFLICYILTVLNYIIVLLLCLNFEFIYVLNIVVCILFGFIYKYTKQNDRLKIIMIIISYGIVFGFLWILNQYFYINMLTLIYLSVLIMKKIGDEDSENSDN